MASVKQPHRNVSIFSVLVLLFFSNSSLPERLTTLKPAGLWEPPFSTWIPFTNCSFEALVLSLYFSNELWYFIVDGATQLVSSTICSKCCSKSLAIHLEKNTQSLGLCLAAYQMLTLDEREHHSIHDGIHSFFFNCPEMVESASYCASDFCSNV